MAEQTKINVIKKGYLDNNATWLNGSYVYAWADTNDDDVAAEVREDAGSRQQRRAPSSR